MATVQQAQGTEFGSQSWRPSLTHAGLFLLGFALILVVFRDGIDNMIKYWAEPEYSHGYLIPLLSLYLLSIRLVTLDKLGAGPSWLGVTITLAGLTGLILGQLSALYVIVHYSFVLTIWGLVVTQVGWRGIKALWPALVFLLFMVPLPRFIQWNLSSELQLISSQIGTAILRPLGVPVFLEGNVIDLGNYKLQVVEACAGLRYLFPLMCFGLLCAVLFRGAAWKKVLLFVSSVPIAVFMNSFRIAVTGLLVNRFGISAAEGFTHYFEGWVVFTACLAIMFLEMWGLAKLDGRKLDDVFDVTLPDLSALPGLRILLQPNRPLVATCALLVLGGLASFALANRVEILPQRADLQTFPLTLSEWRGVESEIPPEQLEELQATDYLLASYSSPSAKQPVEIYVAYYESQSTGVSVHSPRACLPGGGWRVEESTEVSIPDILPSGAGLPVNRTVIAMGDQRMLVYYWFMQRGRLLTNEYLVKWYIFWDSLRLSRSDGALVRLVTPVGDLSEMDAADARLRQFLSITFPRLYYHIPQENVAVGASP